MAATRVRRSCRDKSADSLLIKLVSGLEPDMVMPQKGARLTADQIGVLRAWIDQGAVWDPGVTFARSAPQKSDSTRANSPRDLSVGRLARRSPPPRVLRFT